MLSSFLQTLKRHFLSVRGFVSFSSTFVVLHYVFTSLASGGATSSDPIQEMYVYTVLSLIGLAGFSAVLFFDKRNTKFVMLNLLFLIGALVLYCKAALVGPNGYIPYLAFTVTMVGNFVFKALDASYPFGSLLVYAGLFVAYFLTLPMDWMPVVSYLLFFAEAVTNLKYAKLSEFVRKTDSESYITLDVLFLFGFFIGDDIRLKILMLVLFLGILLHLVSGYAYYWQQKAK